MQRISNHSCFLRTTVYVWTYVGLYQNFLKMTIFQVHAVAEVEGQHQGNEDWYKQNQKELYKRTHLFHLIADFGDRLDDLSRLAEFFPQGRDVRVNGSGIDIGVVAPDCIQ